MGTSLFGLKPKNTYQGLLKTTDNNAIGATNKFVSDGLGNDSALSLGTSLVGIGTTSPTGKLQVNNATNGALISRFKDALAATTYIDFKTDPTLTDRMGLYWGSDYRFLSKQGASLFINCEYNAVFANGLQAITTITPSEVQVGTISGARLAVKSSGATAATTALLVQNSSGTQILKIRDDGFTTIGQGNQGLTTFGVEGTGFVSTSSTGLFTSSSRFTIKPDASTGADGNIVLSNTAGSTFGILKLGGTTTSFPAIKRVGAGIDFVFADDSNYCQIQAGTILGNLLTIRNEGIINTVSAYGLQLLSPTHNVRVGASNLGAAGNASAMLQVDSTTRGFLPPRMTDAQARAIATPAEGLVVYNTTISHLCCYQGGAWVRINHSPM